MGYFLRVLTMVVNREGDSFEQINEVLAFQEEVLVAFCRAPKRTIVKGWQTVADGTLRIKCGEDVLQRAKKDEFLTDPVYPANEKSLFEYHIEFGDIFRQKVNRCELDQDVAAEFIHMEGLEHLALPPRHLPLLDTIQPEPKYGWKASDDRFVVGWVSQGSMRFDLNFRELPQDEFEQQAELMGRTLERRKRISEASERPTNTLFKGYEGSREFLELAIAGLTTNEREEYGGQMQGDLDDIRRSIESLRRKMGY